MLIKTPLLHQSLGPRVFPSFFFLSFSLSLSLYFWLIPWSAEAFWAHFLARASKTLSRRRTVASPTREGAWFLRAAGRALRTGLYWLSAYTRGYQPLSLSYFLTVNSGLPGSGSLKDQHLSQNNHMKLSTKNVTSQSKRKIKTVWRDQASNKTQIWKKFWNYQTGRLKITMVNTVSALKGKVDNMLNQMPNVIREENSKNEPKSYKN